MSTSPPPPSKSPQLTDLTPPGIPHKGSCHCGQVTFEISLPADPTTWNTSKCNCTLCHKWGYLTIHPDGTGKKTFSLLTPWKTDDIQSVVGMGSSSSSSSSVVDVLGDYTFRNNWLHHYFCKACGVGVFSKGKSEDVSIGEWLAVSVLALDGVDLLKVRRRLYWDGRGETSAAEGPKREPVAPGAW